jgi:uncharacterized protein
MSGPDVSKAEPSRTCRLGTWRAPLAWLSLLVLSALISAGWGALGLPAALLLGQQLGRLPHLQAWALLGPTLLLSALHAVGWLDIDLPRWVLAIAYALLGWRIGLGFTRDALIHAGRALPVVLAAALCLMGVCAALAWCLTRLAHIDPLTAYLATSPGGIDSIAIIAASTPQVDLAFVLTLQAVRLLFVILLAPLITRLVVRHSPHLQAARARDIISAEITEHASDRG